ncbi:MAG TPA: hypothetical protein VHB30_04705, partial [Solirubrobacteraceae bacterium]|nr:hypothetical protein [Solirubrobacteraceae bacterium]
LALAAREADVVSLNLLKAPRPTDAALAERVGWVRDAAGPRADAIELQLPLAAVIAFDGAPADAIRSALAGGDRFLATLASRLDVETLAASPLVLAGSTEAMAERLAGLRTEHGIGAVMVPMSQMEALAAVIPHLAGARA